ncbi:MAG: alpha/beta hydrolase [Candidatus Paceibacterota bacterium]|jgi:pimeloyl-ACP methyl ester carboxylesterase
MELFELKENKIDINGIELYYKTAGEGKLLLILHGWGASSVSWVRLIEEMAGKGFKLVIPDLPGFGKTEAPKDIWGIEEYADFILAFVKELNLYNLNLLGHSFGGGIALKVIAKKSIEPLKLILCDAAIVREERLNIRQKVSKFLARIGSKIISKDSQFYMFFEKIAYKIAGAHDYYRANPLMKEVFKKVISEDLTYLLPRVDIPCLIIWGEDDQITPLEDGILFQKEIKDAELKIVKGAKHNPYKTNPVEVSESIINFLNK